MKVKEEVEKDDSSAYDKLKANSELSEVENRDDLETSTSC